MLHFYAQAISGCMRVKTSRRSQSSQPFLMQMLGNVRGCMCLTLHAAQDCDMKAANSVVNMDSDSWHFLFCSPPPPGGWAERPSTVVFHHRPQQILQQQQSGSFFFNPAILNTAFELLLLKGLLLISIRLNAASLFDVIWRWRGHARLSNVCLSNIERKEKMKCVGSVRRMFFLNRFQPFCRINVDHIIEWLYSLQKNLFFFFLNNN